MTRVVLAAGGTAGHVYPAVAVAEELGRRGVEVTFAGTASGREREILRARGWDLELLPGRPFQRTTTALRAASLATIPVATMAAMRLLRRTGARAVVGFGGYAAIGPILAARLLGIRAAILEPNAVLGMANRWLAPVSDRIYTGVFTACNSPKARRTGLPIRDEIFRAPHGAGRNGVPRVLAFDEALVPPGFEVIRPADAASIGEAYAACDIVIARAGAGTLAEISALGLPAIVVPLPDSAEDHQARNASAYAEREAAVVPKSVTAPILASLLESEERRRELGRRSAELAAPCAARDLVDDLLELI